MTDGTPLAPASFGGGLLSVAEAIRLAPSGHNVQPWLLRPAGARAFELDWRRERALDIVDPDGFGVCYCLGCAVEAAATAADVEFVPDGRGDPTDPAWRAGVLEVSRLGRQGSTRRSGLLRHRFADRRPYRPQPPAPTTLAELEAAGQRDGSRVLSLTARREIEEVAELSAQGTRANFAADGYLEELLEWVRLSDAEAARSPDGFTAATLGLDPATRGLFRLLRHSRSARDFAQRHLLPNLAARATAAQVRASGALLLVVGSGDSAIDRLRSGRSMMATWLAATTAGVSAHPVSDALAVPELRTAMLEAFGAERGEDPAVMLRVGYPVNPSTPVAKAPRLPLAEMMGAAAEAVLEPDGG